MADSQRKYPAEFRKKLIDLVHSGRSAESLAQQFDLSAQTIRNWVRAADREETRRLQKENRRLRKDIRRVEMEIEILKKADAWFGRETDSKSSGSSSS